MPIAPDAGNDVIHHVAFDHPGRPQLWKPIIGRAFMVKMLGRMPGVDKARYADFDIDQIEHGLQTITHLTNGDVGWGWADAWGRTPEITLEIVATMDFDPAFRGGVCWPKVGADGVIEGARLAWTPWEIGHDLFFPSLLHELAHGMVGFGHTPDRTMDHIMGSGRWDQRDFSTLEYATWEYMRPIPAGALNPRLNPRLAGTALSAAIANRTRPFMACGVR